MADDTKREPKPKEDVLAGLTSDRVREMTDEARVALAREIAGRKATVTDAGFTQPGSFPRTPVRHDDATHDPAHAAEVARLTAELHRTERRLDRIEAQATGTRYKVGGSAAPTGRYARLLSRADRLERQLRSLK